MRRTERIPVVTALATGVLLAVLAVAPAARGFEPFREFAPYDEPRLRPFQSVPRFEEKEFGNYDPDDPEQPVVVPEYEEGDYSGFSSIKEPEVDLPEYQEPPFQTYKPMPPIEQGPMTPIPEADFQPFRRFDGG